MIDLGHDLSDDTIFWPGGESFNLCMHTHGSGDTFYAAGSISCAEHGGTHVDAPWHFNESGCTVDHIPLEAALFAPCRVVMAQPGCNVEVGDVVTHEEFYGTILPGSIVLCNTGWAS